MSGQLSIHRPLALWLIFPTNTTRLQEDKRLLKHKLCKAQSELRRFNARRKFRAGVHSVRGGLWRRCGRLSCCDCRADAQTHVSTKQIMIINRIKRATEEKRAASPAPPEEEEEEAGLVVSVDAAETKMNASERSSAEPPSPLSMGGKGVAGRSRDSSASSTCSEATMLLVAD